MLCLRQAVLLYAFLIGALPFVACADGFGSFSRHDALKGLTILDAGNIEKVDLSSGTLGRAPTLGALGTSENNEILKLATSCYQAMGNTGSWNFGGKAGLVLVDSSRGLKIAFIESSGGSIRFEVIPAIQVSCDTRGSDASIRDRQRRLDEQGIQEMKRQQELLRLESERYRQEAERLRKQSR